MLDSLLVAAFLLAMVGALYPLVVAVAMVLAMAINRRFRPTRVDWFASFVPAAVYYGLDRLVSDRQNFNLVIAVLELTAFGVFIVVVACIASRPRWLVPGGALGAALAVFLWRSVPHGGWTRMF